MKFRLVRAIAAWLRAGTKSGWRRSVLAFALHIVRALTTVFYTVQNADDAHRLRTTGSPWPTAPLRAHLGPGVYAWRRLGDARDYLDHLARSQGILDLEIVRFRVPNRRLRRLRQLDVDELPDPNEWLLRHSLLWHRLGEPHGLQYVRRGVGFRGEGPTAIEHYVRRYSETSGSARIPYHAACVRI
jgi:hypothetical protein